VTAPAQGVPFLKEEVRIMARLAFLFPGQGAQTVGMARSLCETLPAARELFDRAASILGYDLLQVCANGPAEQLNTTAVSQPAIYVASLAALESLKLTEPDAAEQCVATAGLSLGEYTALTFAGSLTFEEGLRLVQRRGEAMQAAADAKAGTMVSVLMLEQAQVENIVSAASSAGLVRMANFLCPGNVVVSGEVPACREVAKRAEEAGAKVIQLSVAGAFHTPMMASAVESLTAAMSGVTFRPMKVPVWANVTAAPYGNTGEVSKLLARQVVEPVLWEQTMRRMLEVGVERYYEIGPGKVLAGLMKRINRKVDFRNVAA
jgi:[acyl-carrier-protein] S-malonyltransferase